jgi:muramoyltetrapeptide carboxypeptidase
VPKPAPLRPGDTIGILAPSGPVTPEVVQKGVEIVEARGYRVVLGEHLYATIPGTDYLAGDDAGRRADLDTLFAREDIAAIFCAKGGYGSMRLIDALDWPTIAAHPKIFVGYSDITSLHLALARHTGLTTFYGTNLISLSRLDAMAQRVFWQMLEEEAPFGTLPADPQPLQTIVPGSVEGLLTGGCLSLLAHACGASFAPDLRGKIVLIEDVGEAIYRVDRYLTQLRNAGLLQEAAGFVLGTVTGWRNHEADPPRNSLDALWRDIFPPLGKPTLAGFPFGHEPNPLTLPLGVRARLDADAHTLTLLEPTTQYRS